MLRRHFLQLIGTTALAATNARRPIVRTSRLYPQRPLPKDRIPLQPEILALENKIVALHDSTILTATSPSGELLWERSVMAGFAGGLATAGDAILFGGVNGKILRLDPRSGETKPLGSVGPIGGRIFYAGDGRFVRLQRFQIEWWKAGDTLTLEHSISADLPGFSRADQISERLVAVTGGESDSVWLVDTTSGRHREYEIDFSSIDSTRSAYRASGADRARHLAYLLLPIADASVIVTVDPDGNVRRHGSYERVLRTMAIRVLKYGNELGIAHHDGSVTWYAD